MPDGPLAAPRRETRRYFENKSKSSSNREQTNRPAVVTWFRRAPHRILKLVESGLTPRRESSAFEGVSTCRQLPHLNQSFGSVGTPLDVVLSPSATPAPGCHRCLFSAPSALFQEVGPSTCSKISEPFLQLALRNESSSGRPVQQKSWEKQEQLPCPCRSHLETSWRTDTFLARRQGETSSHTLW